MMFEDFKCQNCNPTVFNPEFHKKCEYCTKYRYPNGITIYKGQSCGMTEFYGNILTKEDSTNG